MRTTALLGGLVAIYDAFTWGWKSARTGRLWKRIFVTDTNLSTENTLRRP